MIAASVSKKQIGRSVLAALLVFGAIAAAVVFMGTRTNKNVNDGIAAATEEQRVEYLQSLGYQLDKSSSVAEVLVPEVFDARFKEYNDMLKALGFDLSPHKGEAVKKWTYKVTAGAPRVGNISAVLLVKDDVLIGGHLLDTGLKRIYPLYEVSSEEDAETSAELLDGTVAETWQQTEPEQAAETAADAYPTD